MKNFTNMSVPSKESALGTITLVPANDAYVATTNGVVPHVLHDLLVRGITIPVGTDGSRMLGKVVVDICHCECSCCDPWFWGTSTCKSATITGFKKVKMAVKDGILTEIAIGGVPILDSESITLHYFIRVFVGSQLVALNKFMPHYRRFPSEKAPSYDETSLISDFGSYADGDVFESDTGRADPEIRAFWNGLHGLVTLATYRPV